MALSADEVSHDDVREGPNSLGQAGSENVQASGSHDFNPASALADARLDSPYEIRSLLGIGATSLVYRAHDRALGKDVAIKLLKEEVGLDQGARERFRLESQALSELSHPNIIKVYGSGEGTGRPFMVLELVEGRNLRKWMQDASKKTDQLVDMVIQVADGMYHAHTSGIVHRDLKPSNIFISEGGVPKVGDFGLAGWELGRTSLTQVGVGMGTPSYMSPEQTRGAHREVGPATDIYALGVILYEVLTGRVPFEEKRVQILFQQIQEDPPLPPSALRAGLHPALDAIVLKALEKRPEKRFASARDLASELKRFAAGRPLQHVKVEVEKEDLSRRPNLWSRCWSALRTIGSRGR